MAAEDQPWKPAVATKRINEIARNKQCDLAFTKHATERLTQRSLMIGDLRYVLKYGHVYEEPEGSTIAGLYRYKIENQSPNSGARFLRAVVVPDGKSRQIKVITIMWRDEK
jgi:hypothetical protein